jgi:hypothetical protein
MSNCANTATSCIVCPGDAPPGRAVPACCTGIDAGPCGLVASYPDAGGGARDASTQRDAMVPRDAGAPRVDAGRARPTDASSDATHRSTMDAAGDGGATAPARGGCACTTSRDGEGWTGLGWILPVFVALRRRRT